MSDERYSRFLDLCEKQSAFDVEDASKADQYFEAEIISKIDAEHRKLRLNISVLYGHEDDSVRYWASAISLQNGIDRDLASKALISLSLNSGNRIVREKAKLVLKMFT